MKSLLEIKDLCVSSQNKTILNGINLTINPGEVHVIMGPNGAGKSTLASSILSYPLYKKQGTILFDGEDIISKKTDEIARKGIFLSFQTPEEIDGISVFNFIKTIKSKAQGKTVYFDELRDELKKDMKKLKFSENMLDRDLNVGFSGGEKKKNEILQMLSLSPRLAILDETDSGLDVDAIKIVSKGISLFKNENNAVLIITHSTKILQYIDVDFVHILSQGKIVKSGDFELARQVEERGYDFIERGENA